VLQETDVINMVLNIFLHDFETYFPIQNVTNKTKNNHWITTGIKISCNGKKRVYILSKITNSHIIEAYYTQYSTV
jgi:hypothetical protein